jgi:hypothetical protein
MKKLPEPIGPDGTNMFDHCGTKWSLFKTLREAHKQNKDAKEWITSLTEEDITNYIDIDDLPEKDQDVSRQNLLLCAIYLLGLKKENFFAEHTTQEISDRQNNLRRIFTGHSINLECQKSLGDPTFEISKIIYKDGWNLPTRVQRNPDYSYNYKEK